MELPALACFSVQAAVWVPFATGQPPGEQFPRLKTTSKGLWLKSSEAGVLCIDTSQPGCAPPALTLTLKGRQQLAACPVARQSLRCTALCPAHSGAGAGWVLLLSMRPAVGGKESTMAVRFETEQAGQECAALITGLLDGSAHYTRPAAAAGAQLPGRALLSGAAGGSMGQEEHRGDLKQQIMACLADPEFMAYVGRVELAWVELEQEMGLAP